MSHSITINAQNVQNYLDNCDQLITEIEEQKSVIDSENLNKTLNESIHKILELKAEIKSQIGKPLRQGSLSSLSRFQKEIANLQLLKNNAIIDDITSSSFNITKAIAVHGSIALEAIEVIKSENRIFNNDNLEKTINLIREQEVGQNKRQTFLDEAYKIIDESNLPDIVQLALKKIVRNSKTNQELADISPLILSRKQEYDRLVQTKKDLDAKLNQMNFKIDRSVKLKVEIDDYGNIVFKYSLKNSNNNTVTMILNSDGQIKYKLGNYIGHMCNQTTEKLIQKLKDGGYYINIISIKRDPHNKQLLAMERELK